jgi:hypothetical protein
MVSPTMARLWPPRSSLAHCLLYWAGVVLRHAHSEATAHTANLAWLFSGSAAAHAANLARPSPVATLLAAAPRDCPSGPALGSKSFPQFNGSPARGSGPVWEFGLPPNATVNVDDLGYTPWPGTKILWPIGPDFPNIVTVRVTNLRTGTQAWWDIGAGPPPSMPVRPLILDGAANRAGGPPTFGAFLYLPQAGCYAMTVSWTGGQWRLLFAVGR